MVFKCQEDSFLKELTSTVVSCEKTNEPIIDYGKTVKFEGYAVILEDTILFPAGGGQVGTGAAPHDTGRLNDVEVVQVVRRGEEALHFTREPLAVGCSVTQRLDWARRFDHMQQHSGQHLLSAILEQEHGLPTTSWWLGAEECHVELAGPAVPAAVAEAAEARCNELIREARPVAVTTCSQDQAVEAHTRGLPADCPATLRVVRIAGVDDNMCCGTHVANLSQLQMLKLLGCEAGKKGRCQLRFVVGDRVRRRLAAALARDHKLTRLLNNEPDKHEELIQKLQRSLKVANKQLQGALSALAQAEVQRVRQERPPFLLSCRKEATPEFNRAICKALEGSEVLLVLAAEDPERPREGQLLVQGPDHHCQALGTRITELLKCKGAFKNGKFQGKAGDLGGISKCKQLLEDYFNNLS